MHICSVVRKGANVDFRLDFCGFMWYYCGGVWGCVDLFAKERQDIIRELIKNESAVTTSELTKMFDISLETARRDLLDLEKAGFLKRVHGGAIYEGNTKAFYSLQERNLSNTAEKDELCRVAVQEICENDVIGIDCGSTATVFARAVAKHFSSLTVVTHSLDVFNILCRHRDFRVILCAGNFDVQENAFYGPLVTDSIKNLHVKKLFLFPSAISLSGGITDFCQELAVVQRQFISSASQVFVLADSTKFETHALLCVSETSAAYTYITDSMLPEKLKKLYIDNGINIKCPQKNR